MAISSTALPRELSFAKHAHGMPALFLFLFLFFATIAVQDVHAAVAVRRGGLPVTSFQTSQLCMWLRIVKPLHSHKPPAHVLITTPTRNGSYPVILFKHGFFIPNCLYTQLFQSLASSGYIVVALQKFTLSLNCKEEIDKTAEVANWISKSLAAVLEAELRSSQVIPNTAQLVMVGHSRGGKIAFAMGLGMASIDIIPSFSAVVALDPVDCRKCNEECYPTLVAPGCEHNRNNISVPVLILGTGYGEGDCAPGCNGYMAYFDCSSAALMYLLVASEYGHLDFLNDGALTWIMTRWMCKAGTPKADLRGFSVKLVVAFLKSVLEGDQATMDSIIDNWESEDIKLAEPRVRGKTLQCNIDENSEHASCKPEETV